MIQTVPSASIAQLSGVNLRHGKHQALQDVDLTIPAGCMVGLIGPDGVGKSSLLALIAGAQAVQQGSVTVLGGDMRKARHRNAIGPRIAYMPQGLGRNLYPTLSIEENLQFFGRLFGHDALERRHHIDALTRATNLFQFLDRPVGNLSGGMRQKLGLCCALIHAPDLMILDEPTTGVDPLARSQFWELVKGIRETTPGMSVIVATAYMEEADRFDWLVAMDAGRILATGTPREFHERSGTDSLEAAFIQLLPEDRRREHRVVSLSPLVSASDEVVAIEAIHLTKRFGDFTAVDNVNLRIRRGEIFGFLGSNGCGKTTTMKMLTGLLRASEGHASLFGREVAPDDLSTRRRVGYMSQGFSLYSELSVRQNLELHARLFHVPKEHQAERIQSTLLRFGLSAKEDAMPESLPLGLRQRLSLAVAMVHQPDLLILDEPTSGVDPIARDQFWQLMVDLARRDQVTIFVSTHFMNEATRCDRISFMHAGKVLVSDTPTALIRQCGASTLEEAFIRYLKIAENQEREEVNPTATPTHAVRVRDVPLQRRFSLTRAWSYALRETLELRHDPVRASMALVGSLLLMVIMAYGMSLDVENLQFAVLDYDETTPSRSYLLNITGSRYFKEQPRFTNETDLDHRMRQGKLALALEIPPGFARDLKRGVPVEIGAWIDGAMPQRAETVRGYMALLHQGWQVDLNNQTSDAPAKPSPARVETRFRYNPDVTSLPAMVPAVIPILLLLIPGMLTALSVVREKELGSIINFYVTPVTRTEFLLGKQLPYVVLGMLNYLLMVGLAITLFGVPLKGSFLTLSWAALIYVVISTGMGLVASTFTRSQIAALFFTMIGTMIPAVSFAGLMNPVSSLEGAGRFIGEIYPATHMLIISRGVFSKALGFVDLQAEFLAMLWAVPVVLGLSILLLRKQSNGS